MPFIGWIKDKDESFVDYATIQILCRKISILYWATILHCKLHNIYSTRLAASEIGNYYKIE